MTLVRVANGLFRDSVTGQHYSENVPGQLGGNLFSPVTIGQNGQIQVTGAPVTRTDVQGAQAGQTNATGADLTNLAGTIGANAALNAQALLADIAAKNASASASLMGAQAALKNAGINAQDLLEKARQFDITSAEGKREFDLQFGLNNEKLQLDYKRFGLEEQQAKLQAAQTIINAPHGPADFFAYASRLPAVAQAGGDLLGNMIGSALQNVSGESLSSLQQGPVLTNTQLATDMVKASQGGQVSDATSRFLRRSLGVDIQPPAPAQAAQAGAPATDNDLWAWANMQSQAGAGSPYDIYLSARGSGATIQSLFPNGRPATDYGAPVDPHAGMVWNGYGWVPTGDLASSVASQLSGQAETDRLRADPHHGENVTVGGFLGPFTQAGGMGTANSVRSYATGTPWVPETGLAMLHQGEEVVPATQNPNNTPGLVPITAPQSPEGPWYTGGLLNPGPGFLGSSLVPRQQPAPALGSTSNTQLPVYSSAMDAILGGGRSFLDRLGSLAKQLPLGFQTPLQSWQRLDPSLQSMYPGLLAEAGLQTPEDFLAGLMRAAPSFSPARGLRLRGM